MIYAHIYKEHGEIRIRKVKTGRQFNSEGEKAGLAPLIIATLCEETDDDALLDKKIAVYTLETGLAKKQNFSYPAEEVLAKVAEIDTKPEDRISKLEKRVRELSAELEAKEEKNIALQEKISQKEQKNLEFQTIIELQTNHIKTLEIAAETMEASECDFGEALAIAREQTKIYWH